MKFFEPGPHGVREVPLFFSSVQRGGEKRESPRSFRPFVTFKGDDVRAI